jgi:signal transduction histidine kinase/CheY-like chemotaxis protein
LLNGQFIAEFRIRRRDSGEVRWMAARGTMQYDADGQPVRMLGINVDVTEQKRAAAVVHEIMARKAALLELTRAILAKPADLAALGQIVFSKIASVLSADLGFNYRLQPDGSLQLVACIGVPPEQLGAVQRLEMNEAFCGSAAAAGEPIVADKACIERDPRGRMVGSLGASAYACHPLFSSSGRLLGTLSFGSRSRDRFNPEEIDFLQTLCHVVAMAWERFAAEDAMVQAKEAAERANRAKDEFLAALSHELRTPLNPVLLLSSEMQQRGDLAPELQADIATIRRNVELEARLIDDLLDLTRITRGKLSLNLQPVSARRVLGEALEVVRGDFETKGVELESVFTALDEVVLADATRLQQVFWNVLRNAVKFTPRGGKVTVSTRADEARLEVEITDTGAGIPPDQIEKIFDAFQQGERGHQFGGLGLGLAIARSILEMHHGAIRAHSAGSDRGATFTIELPVCKGAAANGNLPHADADSGASFAPTGLHILLVEDHEPTRSTLKKLLERRRHHVTAAEDLATARELAACGRFDLLLSDLGLPDGDGTDLMRELAERSGLPGIALSGFGMDEDLRRSDSAGFFAHLVKPVDISLLDRTMAALASTGVLAPRP